MALKSLGIVLTGRQKCGQDEMKKLMMAYDKNEKLVKFIGCCSQMIMLGPISVETDAYMVVFDMDCIDSFIDAQRYLTKLLKDYKNSINAELRKDKPVILIGNHLKQKVCDIDYYEMSMMDHVHLINGYIRESSLIVMNKMPLPTEVNAISFEYYYDGEREAVTYKMANKLTKQWNIPLMFVCTETGENVKKAFEMLTKKWRTKGERFLSGEHQ